MGQSYGRSIDKENAIAEIKAINSFYPELKLIKFSLVDYKDEGYGSIIHAHYKAYFSLDNKLNWDKNIIDHIKDFFKLKEYVDGLYREDARIILTKESNNIIVRNITKIFK